MLPEVDQRQDDPQNKAISDGHVTTFVKRPSRRMCKFGTEAMEKRTFSSEMSQQPGVTSSVREGNK